MKVVYQENIDKAPYFFPRLYKKYLRCVTVLGAVVSIMGIDEAPVPMGHTM